MEKPNYYAVIPAGIRYDKTLRASEKLLYGEISALAQKNGECWASNSYFSELYGVTSQAISKWILDLKNRGYITIKYIRSENNKNIEKRVIKLSINCTSNLADEVSTKVDGGYQQKFKENNTSNNNKEEDKEKINKKESQTPEKFYEENITLITPYVADEISMYIEKGLSEDLIIEAMKEAVSRNVRKWNYVVSILEDCINNNINNSKQFLLRKKERKKSEETKEKVEEIEYKEIHYTTEDEFIKKMTEKGKKYV